MLPKRHFFKLFRLQNGIYQFLKFRSTLSPPRNFSASFSTPSSSSYRTYASLITDQEDGRPVVPRKPFCKRRRLIAQERRDQRYFDKSDDSFLEDEKPPVHDALNELWKQRGWPKDHPLSEEECAQLRDDVIKHQTLHRSFAHFETSFRRSVDSLILQGFLAEERYRSALAYTKFLLDSKEDLFNPGCVLPASKVIRDYFMQFRDQSISEQEIDYLAIPIYDKVLTKFPAALRPTLTAQTMMALACSSQWTKALDWQKPLSISEQNFPLISPVAGPVIVKAIENGKMEAAFDVLSKILAISLAEIEDRINEAFWKQMNTILDSEGSKSALKSVDGFLDVVRNAGLFGSCLPEQAIGDVKRLFSR